MNINANLLSFVKKHRNKKNQVLFHKADCKSNRIIENIIDNFLNFSFSYLSNKIKGA